MAPPAWSRSNMRGARRAARCRRREPRAHSCRRDARRDRTRTTETAGWRLACITGTPASAAAAAKASFTRSGTSRCSGGGASQAISGGGGGATRSQRRRDATRIFTRQPSTARSGVAVISAHAATQAAACADVTANPRSEPTGRACENKPSTTTRLQQQAARAAHELDGAQRGGAAARRVGGGPAGGVRAADDDRGDRAVGLEEQGSRAGGLLSLTLSLTGGGSTFQRDGERGGSSEASSFFGVLRSERPRGGVQFGGALVWTLVRTLVRTTRPHDRQYRTIGSRMRGSARGREGTISLSTRTRADPARAASTMEGAQHYTTRGPTLCER